MDRWSVSALFGVNDKTVIFFWSKLVIMEITIIENGGWAVHILLTEDDKSIIMGLVYSLEGEGFTVTTAESKEEALAALATERFDLLLLDVMLPDGSGYDICQAAKAKADVPVIFLTACDEEVNVVMGLDMGADDYITKPFRIRELMSRIKSVLRRTERSSEALVWRFGPLTIWPKRAYVTVGEQEVVLTALEYRLLLTFAANAGQVLSRNQLLEGIWDVAGNYVNDNTLTVYIKRLREKLAEAGDDGRITTVRGLGYRLEVE